VVAARLEAGLAHPFMIVAAASAFDVAKTLKAAGKSISPGAERPQGDITTCSGTPDHSCSSR
jgi:hypothetical protein